MKTNVKLLQIIFLVFFILYFQGCKKSDTVDDPIVPNYDTLFFSIIPAVGEITVVKGSGVSFNISSNADSCFVFFYSTGNQIKVMASGVATFTFQEDTKLDFTFYKKGNNPAIESRNVKVTEVVLKPTISITVSPVQAQYFIGDTITYKIEATNFSSIESNIPGFNGQPGNFPVILNDLGQVIYSAVARNGNEIANATLTISVSEPPPPTFLDYIQSHPWKHTEALYKYFENDPWVISTLSPFELSLWNVFNTNGTWERFKPGSIRIASGPYTIVDSILTWGAKHKIIELNYDIMVIEYKCVCNGCPVDSTIWRDTYVRYP